MSRKLVFVNRLQLRKCEQLELFFRCNHHFVWADAGTVLEI